MKNYFCFVIYVQFGIMKKYWCLIYKYIIIIYYKGTGNFYIGFIFTFLRNVFQRDSTYEVGRLLVL